MAGRMSIKKEALKAWLTLAIAALLVAVVMAGMALPFALCGGEPEAQQEAVTAVGRPGIY